MSIHWLNGHKPVERCRKLEEILLAWLSRLRQWAVVGDIRGKGLLAGIEFVKDLKTKEPFPRSEKFAERLTAKGLQSGLVLWPNAGHVGGTNGDLVILAPPYVITEEQIEELVSLIELSLEQLV